MTTWQPTASLAALHARANLYVEIRRYFAMQQVLEVETGVLSQAGNPEPNIDSHQLHDGRYLNTSPEFHMKRLLAAGVGDCYQIAKAFRQEEASARHNQEFTLLEWYRRGFGVNELIQDMVGLLAKMLPHYPAMTLTYRNAMRDYARVDPFAEDAEEKLAAKLEKHIGFSGEASKDELLQLAMATLVEPYLPKKRLIFIKDFPASQASLAKLNDDGLTAARFELFVDGMELANGFHELTDAALQRERFAQQNKKRLENDQSEVALDEHFLAALESGLPECAGVALGIDRLLMVMLKQDHIQDVMPFTDSNS